MRTFIIIISVLTLAGCATAPRSRTSTGTGAGLAREYDMVQLAPTARGLQPMAPGELRYKVKRGDTLWSIAKAYNVEMYDLAKANSIKNTGSIEKGQILVIPRPGAPGTAKKPETLKYRPARVTGSFTWPVRGQVVSRFGSKVDNGINKGIDIMAGEGTNVLAAKAGKVVYRDAQFKGFGRTVIIDHLDGYQTVYSYNADITVNVGEMVRQKDVIAKVGSSGRAKVPTLHFEIRKNGEPQNPEFYMAR